MIKHFLFTLLTILPFIMNAQNPQTDAPDFAFPQQVIKDADQMLEKALKTGDGTKVVDALIRSGLAQTAISPDSLPSVISKIEVVNAKENDEVTTALLDLLLANIYGEYYQANSRNLNARPELANPGTDITLWSGKEFKDKIIALYDSALSYADALRIAQIEDYSTIIECDKTTARFYPTLFDFASLQAINGISNLATERMSVLAPFYLFNLRLSIPNVLSKPSQKAIEIANNWVNVSTGAPRIAALLTRYALVRDYIVDIEDNGDEEVVTPLMRLYQANSDVPEAVEFLLRDNVLTEAAQKLRYATLKEFVAKHSEYFRINAVKTAIEELEKIEIKLKYPSQVAPGQEFAIEVEMKNINATQLLVYRVREAECDIKYFKYGDYELEAGDCEPIPVATIDVNATGEVPFTDTTKVTCRLNDYGVYVIKSSADNSDYQPVLKPIFCSDIAMMSIRGQDKMQAFAVDGTIGSPLKNVEITTYNNDGRTPVKLRTHTTGKSGAVTINPGSLRNIILQATNGDDRFGAPFQNYVYNRHQADVQTTAFVRTSLAIYHPCDTLDFVAVVYEYQKDVRNLVKNTDFKAILRNPNNVAVDTIDIRTDNFGRATAKFSLPEEGLTGNYSINIIQEQKRLLRKNYEQFIARQNVMVSDYKLPTYEAKVDSVAINDADGSVTVNGTVLTYSGFPVQNANIDASLSGVQRVWWRYNEVKFHTDTLTTDSEGNFIWVLTKEVLDQTPFTTGSYNATFAVTSPTGENHSCNRMFTLSKQHTIEFSGSWLAAKANSDLYISVFNPLGDSVDATLKLTFTDGDKKSFEVSALSYNGRAIADISMLHSGTYNLKIETTDVDANPVEVRAVVYNSADDNSPVEEGLWIEKTSLKADARSRKAEIVYASAEDDMHILMTSYNGEKLIENKWINARKGINHQVATVPDSLEKVTIKLSAIRGFELQEINAEITIDNPDARINVKVERMRNLLTPLTPETVTVKVTNAAGKGVGAAVILDMYSKALDNLAKQSWEFSPYSGYSGSLSFLNNLKGFESYFYSYTKSPYRYEKGIGKPEFNFYDMEWYPLYRNEMVLYSARPVMMSKSSAGVDDMDYVMDTAAPSGAVMDYGAEEEVIETEETSEQSDAESVENQYRPSEVPLAFFAPMLSTDAEGNLTYSFIVPNANTTWVLNALAYNDELATDLDVQEVISAKPIMVEPNMPRFLRTGDVASIRASVMNATDAEANVTTVFEILSAASGEVLDVQTVNTVVSACGSEVVKFNVEAPASPCALMVRVKSSTESYSDGVMTILPILSSSQPVIEATTFYLAPDQKQYEQELPEATADSSVTLSFCENPTWEVVSALPGLRADNDATSLSASARIFAAAVSEYVMQLNPAIEPTLKEWLASADEGNMLSKLNQNEDFKQLLLASTPWVQNAQNDEERISRLALLFDRKEISRNIKSAISTLEKLQCTDGGWKWTDFDKESSYWVTLHILNNFAELKQLGCYPSQLDDMVVKALKFIDAEVVSDYNLHPDWDYSYYAYIRSRYKDIAMSLDAQKVYNAAVQHTLKNWKKSGTAGKAADALLLYRSNYKNVARQILDSLREYATSTPQLGMWWDSLDRSSWHSLTVVGQTAFILQAFNTIEPGCAEVDKIRQWLILNKVVQDWGTSVDASACVAAILQCGSSWLNRPGDAVITIAGQPIEIDRFDKLTGQVVTSITDAAGELKITRTAEGPAWGAVVAQSTQVMKEVEAHSIPELSINKQLFVRTDKGWAQTDSMVVGQVVKVRLVMTAQRDMSYVSVVDNRAAAFEPVIQTPRPVYCDGLVFYLENRDAATNLFIDFMPKGQYVVEYEVNVNNAGEYSSGLATIQSQYTPEMTAHSSGTALTITD